MSYITLRGSVGINGNNHYQDILTIQKALNQRLSLMLPTAKLAEDGSLGINPEKSKTVTAIRLFQNKVVRMIKPDGLINVDGRTHRKINSTSSNCRLLTFPGTSFTYGVTKKTLQECLNPTVA